MSSSKTVKKQAREYTPEFRVQAAKLILEQGGSISQAARDLGVPLATLHTWVKKFNSGDWSLDGGNLKAVRVEQKGSIPSSKPAGVSHKLHDQLGAEQRKNAELERQLRRLTMERDILKKAMAYCLDVPK